MLGFIFFSIFYFQFFFSVHGISVHVKISRCFFKPCHKKRNTDEINWADKSPAFGDGGGGAAACCCFSIIRNQNREVPVFLDSKYMFSMTFWIFSRFDTISSCYCNDVLCIARFSILIHLISFETFSFVSRKVSLAFPFSKFKSILIN